MNLKVLGLILFSALLFSPPSQAGISAERIQRCLGEFNAQRDKKIKLGVPEKHQPRIYIPDQEAKETVIVFTHGILESPYYFKGINQVFQKKGFISISLLLPGHWDKDWQGLETVHYRDWIQEVDQNVSMALCFGKKVILAGHSLGGLLSLHAAVRYSDSVSGVMLWAPAVKMRVLPILGGILGDFFHLNGNIILPNANLDDYASLSPNAANQVAGLIQYVKRSYGNGDMRNVYQRIQVPTLLAYAEKDPAVDVTELEIAAETLPGLKPEYLTVFEKKTGVWHANILKTPSDTYKRKMKDWNKEWARILKGVDGYLDRYF